MSEDPRTDQLRELLELQQTDARIQRLRHRLEDLPEQKQLDEAEEQRSSLQKRHDEVRVDLERIGAAQRKLEGEIDLLRQRRDAEHARMYSGEISNPKELQSLRAEIDATERRIADGESRLLEVMEKFEEYDAAATSLASEHDELESSSGELSSARDAAAQELLAELAELEVVREQQRAGIPEEFLRRYDAKLARSGGVAIGELLDGMCTACRIELPAAEVQQLYDGPPLGSCPQCGRLLVIPA